MSEAPDPFTVLVILGIAALMGKGVADMRSANVDKRRVLGGYVGRDVIVVTNVGAHVSIATRTVGRLTAVNRKGATVMGPDGNDGFIPLEAIRALEHEGQRIAAW